VFAGDLLVGPDADLGDGGVDLGALSAAGLRPTGDGTTGRQVDFSFATQVGPNGLDWTARRPVTGTAGPINKVGPGVGTLAAGGRPVRA